MKPTPGPWEVRRNPAWSKEVDIGQVGEFQNLAFVSSLNEDDARLIAAAPELLQACKDAMTTIDAMLGVIGDFADPWCSDHQKEWHEFCTCFDKLGEAVTKAEGKE
jgi:hypothetical protein